MPETQTERSLVRRHHLPVPVPGRACRGAGAQCAPSMNSSEGPGAGRPTGSLRRGEGERLHERTGLGACTDRGARGDHGGGGLAAGRANMARGGGGVASACEYGAESGGRMVCWAGEARGRTNCAMSSVFTTPLGKVWVSNGQAEAILDECAELAARRGLFGVVVDYLRETLTTSGLGCYGFDVVAPPFDEPARRVVLAHYRRVR